jgi:peptidoglycan hydrolase FlgJ
MTPKELFVSKYWPVAAMAAKAFKIENPAVILAQAAHESAWGTSYSAKTRKNFFGITAYGTPNKFWDGSKSASKTNPQLQFRIYKTDLDSFMDYARLLTSKYSNAAKKSADVNAFAKTMANSSYISESAGDDRGVYEKALISYSSFIVNTLKKNLDSIPAPK